MKRQAFCYLRVSTEEQRTEGISLEAQEASTRRWCDQNGFTPVVFSDQGISGKAVHNRPGLQSAIKAACKAKAPFVVYSLSRFSRSLKDCIEQAERLSKGGSDLVSLSEAIDTTTPTGKLTFHLLGALNQFQRELIGSNTAMALGHLRRQNKRISRHTPFGYDLSATGDLLPNANEQATIDRLAALRSRGDSYPKIAALMTTEGVPCKQSGAWHPATVYKILARRDKLGALA